MMTAVVVLIWIGVVGFVVAPRFVAMAPSSLRPHVWLIGPLWVAVTAVCLALAVDSLLAGVLALIGGVLVLRVRPRARLVNR